MTYIFVIGAMVTMNKPDLNRLFSQKTVMIKYLVMKMEVEDWHAVSDAANDLREIDTQIQTLQWQRANPALKGDPS